jgi:hypothetical protein
VADIFVMGAATVGRRWGAAAAPEARTKLRDAERQFDKLEDAIQMLDRRRLRFLREFRQLLQREMDVVAVEESRQPMEERTIDLELGGRRAEGPPVVASTEREAPPAAQPITPNLAGPPPPPNTHRQDNFLLYLDADADDASR